MENIIGEEVQHSEYGHGVIKFQQTRIGVKFDNDEHIHNFDYPNAFQSCLVAESNRLRDILDKIPNWSQCRYCGLYYILVPSDALFAGYDDSNYRACEKCRKKLFKCGCCHWWFYEPKVIKHAVEDGIPICNNCYNSVFVKPDLQLPIPYSKLVEWGFSLSDLHEYISLFDDIQCIGRVETLLTRYDAEPLMNKKIQRNILHKITLKLNQLLETKLGLERCYDIVKQAIKDICSLAGKRYRDYFKDIMYIRETDRIKYIKQYFDQMDVFPSAESLRGLFESKIFWGFIKKNEINVLTDKFCQNNIARNYLNFDDKRIMHILPLSEVKQIEDEYYQKNIHSILDQSDDIPNGREELDKRIETIFDEILDYDWNTGTEESLTAAIDYYEQTHPSELLFRPNNDILYLYKADCIKCKRYSNHKIISATAMIKTDQKNRVPINIEYCTECEKFIMAYSSFEKYRKRYKFLIIKLQEVDENGDFPKSFLASLKRKDSSPLKLAGYNVNAANALISEKRHQLLAYIITEGVLPKYRVIEYLHYFISQGEYQERMRNAVDKWEEDLEFVENYMIEEQPEQDINYYSKY